MTANWQLGGWSQITGSSSPGLQDEVEYVLNGEFDAGIVNQVADAYRAAINEALPRGVVLCGDEFYAPFTDDPTDWIEGFLRPVISAVVSVVDLWGVVSAITGESLTD